MSTRKNAFDAACDYLSVSERSTYEVAKKLREKGYDEEETQEAIKRLTELGFLDDAGFALRYIESAGSRGRGMKRTCDELRRKGVDSFVIEDAIYDLQSQGIISEEEEKERALEIAMETIRGHEAEIDEKLIAKVGRKLQSRGFSGEEIHYAVSRVRKLKK